MGKKSIRNRSIANYHWFTNFHDASPSTLREPLLGAPKSNDPFKFASLYDTYKLRQKLDLKSCIHQLNSFYAVFWAVILSMILSSFLSCQLSDQAVANAMNEYMYFNNIDENSSTTLKTVEAFCNALVIIGIIACLTLGIVLLYKYDYMKVFMGYCIFYSVMLLGFSGSKIIILLVCRDWKWIVDCYSLFIVMYNLAIVGVISIFYRKGIPCCIEQSYLVLSSIIVSWQLTLLPEWSRWMLLLLLALWDMFAVLSPIGPLHWLVSLMQEKEVPLPGLLFQAEVKQSHYNDSSYDSLGKPDNDSFFQSLLTVQSNNKETLSVESIDWKQFKYQVQIFLRDYGVKFYLVQGQKLAEAYCNNQMELWDKLYMYYNVTNISPTQPYPSPQFVGLHKAIVNKFNVDPIKDNTAKNESVENMDNKCIKLGLGDFIFYSVLVASAALHGFHCFVICCLSVLIGLAITMFLLASYEALPALPISIFLGILMFGLTKEIISPFLEYYLMHGMQFI